MYSDSQIMASDEKKICFSVIVPIYNTKKYLARCIDSIINQTYENIEIILVDDGSTDGSSEICDIYKEKNRNINVIHKKNGGLSSARNAGIEAVTGDYISFVDSDDFIESSLFCDAFKEIETSNPDIVTYGRFDDMENGKSSCAFVNSETIYMSSEDAIRRILTFDKMDVSFCDKIWKRELFDEIRFPVDKNCEDICIITEAISKAIKIVHIGKPYYHYWHRDGSISTTFTEKSIYDLYMAVEQVRKHITKKYLNGKLDNELIFYVNYQYLIIYRNMVEVHYRGELYQEIVSELKNNWNNVYSISRMSLMSKLLYFLLKTKLYLPTKKIKTMIFRIIHKN